MSNLGFASSSLSKSGVKLFYEKDEQQMAYDPYERYDFLQRQAFIHLKNDMYEVLRFDIQDTMSHFQSKGKVMLELGCGIGSELYRMSNLFAFDHYLGCDTSKRFLENAQNLFVHGKSIEYSFEPFGLVNESFQFNGNANIEFCLASAEELPLEDASIDCIINCFLFDRVNDPKKLVDEISRVLRPGGIVITATPFNFKSLALRQMFGDAEKLNGIFELNDLRLLKESKNISLIEPLDISKNKIVWNTALFYHVKFS